MKRKVILLISINAVAFAINCQKNIGLLEPHVYNPKELKKDLDCYINKGLCGKITASCKRRIPQDIAQACAKCNYRQKHLMRLFIERTRELYPDEFTEFKSKYDPSDKYFKILEISLLKS